MIIILLPLYNLVRGKKSMKTKTQTKTKTNSQNTVAILKYLRSLFVSLIITFASIILFAFIIKWAGLDDNVISPVNLVIKGVSVLVGALILTKGASKGLINGIVFALVYTLVCFTIFSILAGTFALGLGLVSDFAFTAVCGGLAGIIGVNIKKK